MTGTDLDRLGGKGANLVRLTKAGLPVPPFVMVPTDEYRSFVDAARLGPVIEAALRRPAAQASDLIRAAFAAFPLPADQAARLRELTASVVGVGPVAVRSSATAEDLPGLSFAGQQDTFLGVTGLDAVLEATVACWSSLWTERAITYRARNGIDHASVSLAVVVQQMVDPAASGVLFTANPRTGRRDELAIDAVPGLGDALVSGRVTPDTFTLDPATGAVREQSLVHATATLNPTHLRGLAAVARRIIEVFGVPMDVEWARTDTELFLLQARPVTSLYPLPFTNTNPHDRPEVWFSFGAFQGLLEPITPLGQDMIRMLLSGAPRLIGRRVDWRANRFVQPAGERLWLRVDGLLRIRSTRALVSKFLPVVEPSVAAILAGLADEPGLRVRHATPPPLLLAQLTGVLSRVGPRARAAAGHPAAARRHVDRVSEDLLRDLARVLAATASNPTPQTRLWARVDALEHLADRFFPALLPAFAPIMGPSIVLLGRLREAAAKTGLADADALALQVLRALPGNVTTEMDLALADVAATIRRDATAWGWVSETPAADLARQFRRGNLPLVAQEAIAGFLETYGMRGVAEIDLGAPRWRDDPTSVMHTLRAYVGSDVDQRAAHTAGQQQAGRSLRRLMDASTRPRARQIRDWAKAIRGLFGARETPKFTLIRGFGLIRDQLDASAAELVAEGRLDAPGDLYFLRADELRHAFSSEWQQVVAARRASQVVEGRRRQVPRVLVEDGRAFHDGLGGASGDVRGVGVSPGVAEGRVRVVLDPRTTTLEAGEILVCPGTDPAWTPLFLTAGGLITEVGGLMTHGSVVAREYGIPAVVGVHDATTRLVDGQRIRLDGTSGAIELLP